MKSIYIDLDGGLFISQWRVLKYYFPHLRKIKKTSKRILGQITIDDMTAFTNYVENNQQ